MADLLPKNELAETNGKQDAHGRENKIQQMRLIKSNPHYQITDAMSQFLDDDGGHPSEKTSRDAEQQQKLMVCQMGLAPSVKPFYPLIVFQF